MFREIRSGLNTMVALIKTLQLTVPVCARPVQDWTVELSPWTGKERSPGDPMPPRRTINNQQLLGQVIFFLQLYSHRQVAHAPINNLAPILRQETNWVTHERVVEVGRQLVKKDSSGRRMWRMQIHYINLWNCQIIKKTIKKPKTLLRVLPDSSFTLIY